MNIISKAISFYKALSHRHQMYVDMIGYVSVVLMIGVMWSFS